MTLSVKHQVIKTVDGKIKVWRDPGSGAEHYHVGIWIDGQKEELDEIKDVEYILHGTFKNRNRKSSNRSNKFSITIWTWGYFDIRIITTRHDNRKSTMDYFLSYELPDDDGTNYALVD